MIKWMPSPISSNDRKAVKVPNENQSTFSVVMNAILKTYSTESRSRLPPSARRTIPAIPRESIPIATGGASLALLANALLGTAFYFQSEKVLRSLPLSISPEDGTDQNCKRATTPGRSTKLSHPIDLQN